MAIGGLFKSSLDAMAIGGVVSYAISRRLGLSARTSLEVGLGTAVGVGIGKLPKSGGPSAGGNSNNPSVKGKSNYIPSF